MGVLEVVAKVYEVDEAAGDALVEMVVYDYLTDLAEAYRPTLNGVLGPWALDRIQLAKRALGRSYVSKAVEGTYPDGQMQQVAGWLVGLEQYLVAACAPESVSKAFEWFNYERGKRQVSVNRDARGRFARSISQDASRDVANLRDAEQAPMVRGRIQDGAIKPESNDQYKGAGSERAKLTDEEYEQELRRAQGQWVEATGHITDLKRQLPKKVADEADAVLLVQGPAGSRFIRIPLKNVKNGEIPSLGAQAPQLNERLIHVEVAPGDNPSPETYRQIAALNVIGSVAGEARTSAAMTDPKRWSQLSSALGTDANSRDSKLTRFFNQVQAGGGVLSGVKGAEQYGRFAQFVGEMGPEAEKVLGPYVQRAAYRYRGTETSPDKQLKGALEGPAFREVNAIADGGSLSREQAAAAAAARTDPNQANRLGSRLVTDAVLRRQEGITSDSLRMQVRSDMAAAFLADTLPKDPIIARLSEKSGQILPSQGVLIDADGKVVSQAVGFSDDHYLPFDLKNLGALRGGQYVRTRQSGGLTGEDVYAAVTTGARMVTVVSPSGVFTLEMAPDFRGARSMSDKARGMYDRYLKILDAVDGSGEYLEDIPATEKQKIVAGVRALKLDPERTRELIDERLNEAREKAQMLQPEDIEQITMNLVQDRYNGIPPERMNGQDRRRFEDDLNEAIDARSAELANKLRLNGQGYAVALQTLKQQYPYFIKDVRYQELNDFARQQGLPGVKGRTYAGDKGYVEPGALRARSTQEGFYNPSNPGNRSWKQDNGKTATTSGVSTPAAPAAQTAADTAATPEGGASVETPALEVGVQQQISDMRPYLAEQQKKAIGELTGAYRALPVPLLGQMGMGASSTQANLNPKDKESVVAWALTRDTEQFIQALGNKDVVAALADTKAVQNALTRRLQSPDVNPADVLPKFGNAGSTEDAAAWFSTQAKRVADATVLLDPFSGSDQVGADQVKAPMVDREIAELATKPQLDAYATANKDIWNAAVQLAEPDGEYVSLVGVAAGARDRLKGMDKLDAVKAQIESTAERADINRLGMGVKDMADAMGVPENEVTLESVRGYDTQMARRQVKLAWQLATTARVLEMLGGGDVLPKDKASQWLVAKALTRVRVLDSRDPLSRAVQARVSKGMPFVPHRVRRTSSTGSSRTPA